MGHSANCLDLNTYWNRTISKCVSCPVTPGYEITPNCGYEDNGSRHDVPATECKANTFNDGSSAYCQPCTTCPHGYNILSPCNTTADTKCQDPGSRSTRVPVASQTSEGTILTDNPRTIPPSPGAILWAVPLVILISSMLVVICARLIYMKRKRGWNTVLSYSRRSSYVNAGFSPLSAPTGNNEQQGILSPNIMSAPLQTVLDNLDVLEELVILLDPEYNGIKNTKHLASHCSFPATWITYTYSMKDNKSPLKAVLEGITSRQPDWTVGHLAKLLRHMERNDAIVVLDKLGRNVMEV
ncbi:IGF-like family receptor 1 [Cottoperca gobio]|uniref:IGF-like family receptor 1 n=1 Tax=Cottoperca gobio TaxID=56716 RepID=A0A6J2R8Q8_COTGO|nr:IGF-like family receptor 1 [Cottoperca gobio]